MPIPPISTEEVARRTMNLFFLVDTSASMAGRKIATLNQTVRKILPALKEFSEENADVCIRVAVLEFSNSVNWMYVEPLDANDFEWIDLFAEGITSMGAAWGELNSKLSRSAFISQRPTYRPVIILLSDGYPTDNYKQYLELLKRNKWFQCAIKIAIAIGNGADTNVLSEFAGNVEAVFSANNGYMLGKIIEKVCILPLKMAWNIDALSIAHIIRKEIDESTDNSQDGQDDLFDDF